MKKESQHHTEFPGGHPSKYCRAQRCLTFVIGQEWVLSTRYERWLQQLLFLFVFDAQKNRILKET